MQSGTGSQQLFYYPSSVAVTCYLLPTLVICGTLLSEIRAVTNSTLWPDIYHASRHYSQMMDCKVSLCVRNSQQQKALTVKQITCYIGLWGHAVGLDDLGFDYQNRQDIFIFSKSARLALGSSCSTGTGVKR